MSEEMLVCHCSPTLAGLKTGSLFSCPYSSQKMIIKEIREFNQKLTQKGIRIIPVRISDKRMLVYVYRPEKLKEDFSDEKTQIILKCKGYDCTNPSQCICRLIQKLQSDPDFPHEIGLFLGYPAEDVKGFCLKNIKNAQKFIAGDGKVAWLLNSLRLLYNHKLQKGR